MEGNNIEYELKALAPAEDKLTAMVNDFYKDPRIKKQIDKYYDTKIRELFRFGVFLRNRNDLALDIKYNPDQGDITHFKCEETSFSLPLSEESLQKLSTFLNQFYNVKRSSVLIYDIDAIMNQIGLENFVTIDKEREIYRKEGVEFCVDTVRGLGKFIEIECTEHETAKKYIEWSVSEGVKPIPVGYVELFLRKYDYDTYISGRYLLDGDRHR